MTKIYTLTQKQDVITLTGLLIHVNETKQEVCEKFNTVVLSGINKERGTKCSFTLYLDDALKLKGASVKEVSEEINYV